MSNSQGEIWCHRYHLRNLCDERRFPDWPVVDHLRVLQSLMGLWKQELAKEGPGMGEEEAMRVMGITRGEGGEWPGAEAVRRAYRAKARECHPDR